MITRTGAVVAIAAAVLLLAGLLMDYPELVMIGLAGAVALLVAALWMIARPQLSVSREILPFRVAEGSSARGVLTVTNTGPRRSPPLVVTETVADQRVSVPLPSIGAGSVHETTYPLPTGRRGRYQIPALTIGHSDPLRLLRIGRTASEDSVLLVHPKVHHIVPVPIGGPRDVEGPTTARSPQGGVAFHSLRDYQPGDDWRLIDWKSTARTGTLVVRHNVIPDEPRQLIVLDTSALSYGDGSFEDAVRVAASLCVAAVDAGFPLDLRVTGEGPRAPQWTDNATAALDQLSIVHPTDEDPGLAALPEIVHDVLTDGAALAVVTGRPAAEHLELLASLRPRFLTVTLAQIGTTTHNVVPREVISVGAPTSERFAAVWNQLVPG
ncbi:DUF58 domain-containing protein [Actinocrispum sp. NPDC049592]|uniref:DUF58 domain-containing protein n=1 Tax=Actinocrispum sp. NPDC049592 TaxID=3154835 RepID=UPI003428A48F